MGRRVGSFVDPITGEDNWLDVSTVKNIKVAPITARCFGSQNNLNPLIEFKLDNVDMLKVITLVAEYDCGEKVYRSDVQQVDELVFGENLAQVVYDEQTIDSADFMKEMKNDAIEDLKGRLLSDGIFMDDIELSGAGFVYSKNLKVMTIDKIKIVINDNNTANVSLINCVGNVSLSNLIEPEIYFNCSGIMKLKFDFEILEENEGSVKSYLLRVDHIETMDEDGTSFKPINLNTERDESIEEFIMNRKEMLDDFSGRDDSLDDRFADIF